MLLMISDYVSQQWRVIMQGDHRHQDQAIDDLWLYVGAQACVGEIKKLIQMIQCLSYTKLAQAEGASPR